MVSVKLAKIRRLIDKGTSSHRKTLLGRKVRHMRRARRLTQVQLAEQSGASLPAT